MAYADGELDADTRREIEAAMAQDQAIAAEVARHRALRDELRGAFSGVLGESVPSRLIETAETAPAKRGTPVVDLAAARAVREGRPARQRWSWPEWTSIAASLLIGVLGGRALLQSESANLVATDAGHLVAAGALASALSAEVGEASDTVERVDIGFSFRAKDGNYCRTFALPKDSAAGVACRQEERWRIEALAAANGTGEASSYRQAGTALPPMILAVVETTIAGDALSAEEEAEARARNWDHGRNDD